MTTIDFVFGVSSRYSYLAASQLPKLASDYGVTFRWRPVTTIALIRQARGGTSPFDGAPPAMQYDFKWRRQDAEIWADLYGIPFNEPHGRLKYDAAELNLGCVAADLMGATESFARALATEVFVTDRKTLGRADLPGIAAGIGLDAARFTALLDAPETKAAAQAIQDEAVSKGVFGVPSFVVGKRVIWGNDRIPLLRHLLEGRR